MAHTLESILADLYQIDPSFKQHEKELRIAIEKLLAANPAIEMNPDFSSDLRLQLVRRAKALTASRMAVSSESSFVLLLKRMFYPFTGGVLATLLVIAMINPQFISSQPEGAVSDLSVISSIDARIVEVDSHLTTCVKTELPLLGQSTEGGAVTFYHKPAGLQKIKEELLGEAGKTLNKYYYDQEKLVYVIHEVHEYNRPIYWDEKKAAESGDPEVFDPKKSVIRQSIYYFDGDHLVRWVDENSQVIDITQDATQALQGEFLLNRSNELRWRYEASLEKGI